MRDSIGAHLAESNRCAMNAATCIHLAGEATTHGSAELYATKRVKWEGAAAGHAFRAAELIHDRAVSQGEDAMIRERVRVRVRAEIDLHEVEMAVHWSGEE